LKHRNDFINQIDPKTGKLDLAIGIDILARAASINSDNRFVYQIYLKNSSFVYFKIKKKNIFCSAFYTITVFVHNACAFLLKADVIYVSKI